jgi:hypothetical protein
VGKSVKYYNKPKLLKLIKEIKYFVFIIYSGFIISNNSKVYIGNKVGQFVDNKSILILKD